MKSCRQRKKNRANLICSGAILLLYIALASGTAWSGNKALLIGVGDYKNSRINDLDGIDLDINMMKTVAGYIGFRKGEITTLFDEYATHSRVKQALKDLAQNVSANDKVLIYFSGHGSSTIDHNGDEKDGKDEVLVLYDTDVVSGELRHALLDDDFYRFLSDISSNQILVIVDSCHSGTGTKGLRSMVTQVDRGQIKSFTYQGMGKGTRGFAAEGKNRTSDNYVSIAACHDDEESVASKEGSYFTLGVLKAMRNAVAKGGITPKQIQQSAASFINRELPEDGFNPQLYGNKSFWNKTINLRKTNREWGTLEGVAQRAGNNLNININKSSYNVGDELVVKVNLEGDGYLNIISVSENDEPVILYPNKFNQTNYHKSGNKVVIPTQQMDFALVAQDDNRGKTLIFAMLTKENINFFETGFKNSNDVFATLSPKIMKNFGAVAKQSLWAGTCKTVIK